MNRVYLKICLLAICCVVMVSCGRYVSYTDTVNVNGVELFYAVEGRGKPVILLHGNGGSHNDLETSTRQLAQAGYKVYAIDSRGQGANEPLAEYHYKDMAEDIYQFIRQEGLHQPAVYGFSDGGIVALQLEVMYPGTLSAIATSGANIFVENALEEEFSKWFFSQPDPSPLTRMMMVEPNMSVEDMASITIPALIMAGDNDLIREEHTRLIGESIPLGEVLIVEDADHGSYIYHDLRAGNHLLEFFNRIGY